MPHLPPPIKRGRAHSSRSDIFWYRFQGGVVRFAPDGYTISFDDPAEHNAWMLEHGGRPRVLENEQVVIFYPFVPSDAW